MIIDISEDSVDRAFTYSVPEELSGLIRPGVRVEVPFGNRKTGRTGFVVSLTDKPDIEESRIKPVKGLKKGALSADDCLISLAVWLSETCGSTLNQAISTVMLVKDRVRKNRRRRDAVAQITDLGSGGRKEPELNEDQKRAVRGILETEKTVSLLYGVTGSGKTQCYIALIREMQKKGLSTIVLIPEISLAYQTVNELSARFGDRVAVMHSRLSDGERYEEYMKAANGEIFVMAGARSAVFAPFENLGLIIIDEEHDHAYQSDQTPRYDTRAVAEKRAELCGAKVVLGSATPSVGTYKKALEGNYALFCLPKRAVSGAQPPKIRAVDMRKELEAGNRSIFSVPLYEGIQRRLSAGEQVMLFLNRRGYAGFVSCRSCGYVVKCPHCEVSMTAHNSWYRGGSAKAALLSCHYCGSTAPMPSVCPVCGSRSVAPFGTGTQRLESELKKLFPAARVLRMDADSTRRKGGHDRILAAFRNHEADILIGTQMIVKGHDFPLVTLVGIVAADLSLNSPEFDASERTFQLITQAAGRSGRAGLPGEVTVQTYDPSHYAVDCAVRQDYEGFYARELSYRKLMGYPPEQGLLTARLSSDDEELLLEACAACIREAEEAAGGSGAEVIGPAEAWPYRLRDIYRKIIYVKSGTHAIIDGNSSQNGLFVIRERIRECLRCAGRGRVYLSFEIR